MNLANRWPKGAALLFRSTLCFWQECTGTPEWFVGYDHKGHGGHYNWTVSCPDHHEDAVLLGPRVFGCRSLLRPLPPLGWIGRARAWWARRVEGRDRAALIAQFRSVNADTGSDDGEDDEPAEAAP